MELGENEPADAGSDNVLKRGGKLEECRLEKEIVRNSWAKQWTKNAGTRKRERTNRNAETVKSSEVHLVAWFSVEHGKKYSSRYAGTF